MVLGAGAAVDGIDDVLWLSNTLIIVQGTFCLLVSFWWWLMEYRLYKRKKAYWENERTLR